MNDNTKKVLVIFEQVATKKQIRYALHDIIDFYTKRGYLVTVCPTTEKKSSYSIMLQQQELFDLLICCGGSVALNETVSGMLDSQKDIAIGFLATGMINDFGRKLGLSQNIGEALETSVNGREDRLDVGMFNDFYFLDTVVFGTFSKTLCATSQKPKNIVGSIAYFLEGIRALSELKAYTLNIKYDNNCISDNFILGIITNSLIVSENVEISKNIEKVNDGIFDMMLIKMPENINELRAVITALIGKREDNRNIIYIKASEIHIDSEMVEWSLDGDFKGYFDKVAISNRHQAIRMMLPQ